VYPNKTRDQREPSTGEDNAGDAYLAGELPMTQSIENVEYVIRDLRALFDGCKAKWMRHLKDEWAWENNDIDGGAIVTVSDEAVPIRIEPMADPSGRPSSVYTVQAFKPKKLQLFGGGIPEKVREEQIELAAIRNQIIDGTSKQIRRRTYYNRSADLPLAQLKKREHDQMVPVDALEGGSISDLIQEENVLPVPRDAYEYAAPLEQDIRDRSHVQDMTMGRPASKRMSATETSQVAEGADMVSTQEIRRFEMGGLVRALENTYRSVRRRTTKPLAVRVAGEDGAQIEEIDPEKLWGDFDFVLTGAWETSNRFLRLNQMIQLMQNPEVMQYMNAPKITKRFLTLLGEPDPSDLVADPNKPSRMLEIDRQWSVFIQGEEVEVTGRETMGEHEEAIRRHTDQFLAHTIPAMLEAGHDEKKVAAAQKACERNIADHQFYVERHEQEMEQMALAMAAKGGQGGGGLGRLKELAPPGAETEPEAITEQTAGVSPVPGG
jgi:hypothetical protein